MIIINIVTININIVHVVHRKKVKINKIVII